MVLRLYIIVCKREGVSSLFKTCSDQAHINRQKRIKEGLDTPDSKRKRGNNSVSTSTPVKGANSTDMASPLRTPIKPDITVVSPSKSDVTVVSPSKTPTKGAKGANNRKCTPKK